MGRNFASYKELSSFTFSLPDQYNFCYDVLDAWSARSPKDVALISVAAQGDSSIAVTIEQLVQRSNQFSNALLKKGIQKGDRILLLMARSPEWYYAFLGSIRLGVIPIPTVTLSTEKDLAYRFERAEPFAIVSDIIDCDKVENAFKSLKSHSIKLKIFFDGFSGTSSTSSSLPSDWISLHNFMANEPKFIQRIEQFTTFGNDPMLLYFTSGTTGMPKMVRQSHYYAAAHYTTAFFTMDLKPHDICWSLADTGWAKTAYGKLFGQWIVGCTVLQHRQEGKFEPKIVLSIIEKYKVTVFCAPPTGYRMMLQENLSDYNLTSLRVCLAAGEPLNKAVIEKWSQRVGPQILDFYGQTETSVVCSNFIGEIVKPGSMGRPSPNYIVKILNEEGKEAKDYEEGEIAIALVPRPKGLFIDYWKDEELTEKVFQNGYYYTRDKAYRDEDGFFYFIGRSDDVFKASGYRIGPFEIESALVKHPAVVEAAVVASPDDTRGDVVKAFVVLAAGYSPSPALTAELEEFVAKTTAPYKKPRKIEYRTELPKTISGKIRRNQLRAEELQKINARL